MNKYIKYHLTEYTAALLFFLMLRPYFTWRVSHILIMVPLFLVLLPHVSIREKGNSYLLPMFFAILCIVPIMHGSSMNTFLGYVMFSIIPFLKKSFALNTFKVFRDLLAVVTAVSLLVWFYVIVFHNDLHYTIIAPFNSLKSYNYLSFPFLVVPQILDGPMSGFRFCGLFDEPGAIGTYSLLILYIENFNFKKWYNVIYLIAGAASFSLFFYVGLGFFLLLRVFTIKEQKKYRYWVVGGVLLLYVGTQTVPILKDMIGVRLEYDEDRKKFVGDNRSSEELDEYIVSIRGTNAYAWGDRQEVAESFNRSASIKNAILRYGMVFIVFFFIFYFLYARKHLKGHKAEIALFIVLLLLTLYQRPGFVSPAYLFLFSIVVLVRSEAISARRKIVRNQLSTC